MDHKVSKDMISSGMIPSGEKTQADLGRTQYGSAPSPNALLDAYKSMYEHHKKDADGNTIPHEDEEIKEGNQRDPESSKKDRTHSKQPDPSKDGFTGIGNMSVNDIMKMNAKMKKEKKDVKEMIERIAGMPPAKPKAPSKPNPQVDKMKGQIADRKKEVASEKDARREKVKGIMNKMGESADLFDIVSTYFIEEGYDKKDVYEAMSSVDLSEEVQDIHEVIPAVMAGVAKVGGMLAKGGAMASKVLAGAGKVGAAAGKVGAAAGKVGSGAAKITSSGGKVVSGGGPTSLMGKAKKFVKDNPLTSYTVARDMTSGGGGGQQPMTRKTSSISASADLFDIVKGKLLDEGLSEEDIKDIMLTLTPDEIMEELSDSVKRIDAQNKANFIKRAKENTIKSQVPDKVREASKRQYKAGTPREDPKNPYTSGDRETIKNYYSKRDQQPKHLQ